MEKINWNEISINRDDVECLNCQSGHATGNLGIRRLSDDFIQFAMTCKDCGNIIITISEEYNAQCPTCGSEDSIRKSDLKNIEKEKLEIKNKVIDKLIIDLVRMSKPDVEWNNVMFLEFLENHKIEKDE